jgi:hypothetical protein
MISDCEERLQRGIIKKEWEKGEDHQIANV